MFAVIFIVSGTNSATLNVVYPNMSWGFARTFNEYRRIVYSPIGAVVEVGAFTSNMPSDVRDMFFSNIMRPRESVISMRTGTPANGLNELFFIIAPIVAVSPGRYMPRSVNINAFNGVWEYEYVPSMSNFEYSTRCEYAALYGINDTSMLLRATIATGSRAFLYSDHGNAGISQWPS